MYRCISRKRHGQSGGCHLQSPKQDLKIGKTTTSTNPACQYEEGIDLTQQACRPLLSREHNDGMVVMVMVLVNRTDTAFIRRGVTPTSKRARMKASNSGTSSKKTFLRILCSDMTTSRGSLITTADLRTVFERKKRDETKRGPSTVWFVGLDGSLAAPLATFSSRTWHPSPSFVACLHLPTLSLRGCPTYYEYEVRPRRAR